MKNVGYCRAGRFEWCNQAHKYNFNSEGLICVATLYVRSDSWYVAETPVNRQISEVMSIVYKQPINGPKSQNTDRCLESTLKYHRNRLIYNNETSNVF